MPTYAYACRDCDHRFEAVQSFSDDSLSVCPECDGCLRKVFNSVGIVFKVGGFYRNDSRSGGADSGASTSSASSASSASSTAEPAAPAKTATPATAGAGASSSSASATAGGSSD